MALEGVTPPPGCPMGRLFVPERLRSNVIQWGHCSNVACHPGIGRTMFLVYNDSGGGPWLAISESLFWPAQSVLGVRLPIDLQRGYFSRCQALQDPGPISR